MLPWLTGPRQQHRARSKALCRGATCRHNRVTSREFHGTYFLLAQAGRMVNATCRLQKGQVAAPNGPAKPCGPGPAGSSQGLKLEQAYGCHAASGLISRAGRGAEARWAGEAAFANAAARSTALMT